MQFHLEAIYIRQKSQACSKTVTRSTPLVISPISTLALPWQMYVMPATFLLKDKTSRVNSANVSMVLLLFLKLLTSYIEISLS